MIDSNPCASPTDNSAAHAARRLRRPAIALIATAAIGFFGNCVLGLPSFARPREPFPAERPASIDEATWESYRMANDYGTAPFFGIFLAVLPMIVVYPVVLIGGLLMRGRRHYVLCVIASLFAMFPCGFAFFVGLPAGFWALYTLAQREVRAVF